MMIFSSKKKPKSFLIFLGIFCLLSCAQKPTTTVYRERQSAETGQVYSYEEWVSAIGQEKTDYLYKHNGVELNLLASGAGVSNIVSLLNAINTDIGKVSALLGNDYDNLGAGSGLGAARLLRLMNRVDYFMTQPHYDGQPLPDQDTIGDLAKLVNTLDDVNTVNTKVVALIHNGMGVTRYLTDANDEAKLDKLAILIAHVNPVTTIPSLINEIPAAKITTNLSSLLLGVTDGKFLVDLVENVANAEALNYRRLVYILTNINAPGDQILYRLINDVESPKATPATHNSRTKLYSLVNGIENDAVWSADAGGQPGGRQKFDLLNTAPTNLDSGMVRLVALLNQAQITDAEKLAYLIKNLSDTSGTTKLVRLLQDMDRITDLTNITDTGIIELLDNPGLNGSVQNLTDLVEATDLTAFFRLRNFVNGIQGNSLGGSAAQQLAFRASVAQLLKTLPNSEIARVTFIVSTLTSPVGINNLIRVVANAPGDKLVTLVVEINPLDRLIYLLDTIPSAQKIAELITLTTAGKITYIAQLVNGIPAPNGITVAAGSRSNATGLGRLINLIEYTDNRSIIAALMENVSADGLIRLTGVVNGVTNSNNLVCLLNAMITTMYSTGGDLAALMNNLDDVSQDIIKINLIIDNLSPCGAAQETATTTSVDVPSANSAPDLKLLAQLLGPLGGTNQVGQGVSADAVANLIKSLPENANRDASVLRLVQVIKDVGIPSLTHNTVTIVKREAFVRLLSPLDVSLPANAGAGLNHQGISFPGIGAKHIATMMANASSATALVSLINNNDLGKLAVLVGCLDHVGDPNMATGDPTPLYPNFLTPCSATTPANGWIP
jgi:hypothetical protein